VLLVMLAPLVFLVALWPGLGRHWLARWSHGVVRSLLGQVLAASLLGLFLMVVLAVAELESTAGWELVAGLLVALSAAVLGLRRLLAVRRRGAPVIESRPAPQVQSAPAPDVRGGAPATVVVANSSSGAPAGGATGTVVVPAAVQPDPAVAELAGELAEGRTRALLGRQYEAVAERPAALPLADRSSSGPPAGMRPGEPAGRPASFGGNPAPALVVPTRPQ
jgi:hypothetical protein